MKKILLILLFGITLSTGFANQTGGNMKLPEPKYTSNISVEEAMLKRRSVRSYKDKALTVEEVSQILWSVQGKTAEWGGRTVPSAGATYPLEIYLVAGKVEGIEPGVYHYNPANHSITIKKQSDVRSKLAIAALGQEYIAKAPISIVISAIYERTTRRYGERGIRYVYMEAGHAGQNCHLQCETMGLGTVMIGAFDDEEVKRVLGIAEAPLYIMPVGKK
jgi:SagB-type dehydrogenase family enzyme